MTDAELIISREKLLLDPRVRRSGLELANLLAEDFIEFGSDGKVYDRQMVVAGLANESPANIEISDASVRFLEKGTALLTYRSMRHGDGDVRTSLRSSIWRLGGGIWRLIFHQGTRISN